MSQGRCLLVQMDYGIRSKMVSLHTSMSTNQSLSHYHASCIGSKSPDSRQIDLKNIRHEKDQEFDTKVSKN